MSKLRKIQQLNWNDCLILARAFLLLPAVEMGLRLVPFRILLRWAQPKARPTGNTSSASQLTPERMAWLVDVAARLSPLRPTCLRKSLVLCALLSKRGFPARLMIGARKAEEFQAHAWVELNGKVLGVQRAHDYHELALFESASGDQQAA